MTRPRAEQDADGICRGLGLSVGEPAARAAASAADGLEALERGAVLALQRRLRTHPLGAWVRSVVGVGEKTAARLLGAIGDPYWNPLHDRPRLVSELWAYCGLHGPHGRKRKGVAANWNQDAKVRAYLVAEACIRWDGQPDKNGRPRAISPYRAAYNAARSRYVDKVHTEACARCGPAGKPAQPGSPWSDGHRHGAAMRLVMKALLRDLWLEAKKVHEVAA
jgi:hypothetical protein